jgi:hypothetical protein
MPKLGLDAMQLAINYILDAMQLTINYIWDNKEWMFSGIGITALAWIVWLVIRLFFSKSPRSDEVHLGESRQAKRHEPSEPHQSAALSSHWRIILPPQSKYEFVRGLATSVPAGLQSFSFEYGPEGHANALTLKGAIVRAEIQFTCRIINPHKALFGANEYALNVLQPKFLVQARDILERFSLTRLRANREEAAQNIMKKLSPQFEKLGVRLESVTIGALDRIECSRP